MFLSRDSFEEINKIFIPSNPIDLIDKEGEVRSMDSLYELEDYIKEYIYDKKYPGVLPVIDGNIISPYEESDEEEEQEQSFEKNNADKTESKNNKSNQTEKKYKIISGTNDIITFEGQYSTDDEDEYNAIKLINENRNEGNEEGWILSINKDKVKIYYKIVKLKDEKDVEVDSLFFYADAIIDYPSVTAFKYINDFEFRREFDDLYKQGKIIKEENNQENNLKIIESYLYMKMPFMFSDRDFVVRKKIWSNYNNKKDCFLIHIKSIEHSDYPPKDKPVRARFINRAAYICPDEDDGHCKFYLGTCFDMKVNVGVSMMKSKGSEGQSQWIDKFIKNIQKHED